MYHLSLELPSHPPITEHQAKPCAIGQLRASYLFYGAIGKEAVCYAGDTGDVGSIPGSGRSPGGGNNNPLWYSCLGNSMDREPGRLQSVGLQKVGHCACVHRIYIVSATLSVHLPAPMHVDGI